MSPIVSIIVPCYQHAHFLDEALQSVLEQSYSNWECIIVNDGSPDNTREITEKWTEKDCRFVYLSLDCWRKEKENSIGSLIPNSLQYPNFY